VPARYRGTTRRGSDPSTGRRAQPRSRPPAGGSLQGSPPYAEPPPSPRRTLCRGFGFAAQGEKQFVGRTDPLGPLAAGALGSRTGSADVVGRNPTQLPLMNACERGCARLDGFEKHQDAVAETLDPKATGRAFVFIGVSRGPGDDRGFVGGEFTLHGQEPADRVGDATVAEVEEPVRGATRGRVWSSDVRRRGPGYSLGFLLAAVFVRGVCATRSYRRKSPNGSLARSPSNQSARLPLLYFH
jgi:hypothetical protein